MITIKNSRAEVSADFIELAKECMLIRLDENTERLTTAPERVKKEIQCGIDRINKIFDDPAAFDLELTKFRGLPYKAFGQVEYEGEKYLAGKTKNVFIIDEKTKYDLGEYLICVPRNSFHHKDLSGFQFIPLRMPRALKRFPHHYASHDERDPENYELFLGKPLSADPHTCWGSFAPIVMMLVEDGDIAELFRTLGVYISRYDKHSVLGGNYVHDLPFVKREAL